MTYTNIPHGSNPAHDAPAKPKALSVSELNRQVKRMLEVSYAHTWVCGEITGLSRPRSGHWYFTLKDDKAQIRCAMFKGYNQRLKFIPKEGDQIVVRAKVSLYEGRGDYQLIVEGMEPAGLGQLQAAFEALKLKLAGEGLFDPKYKKPIPQIPKTAAIITSQTGAVIHDIISVTQRRFPSLQLILLPVQVQGEGSAEQIAQAIEYCNTQQVAEVLIVGRGGGSLEDLWSFNEEIVARAIFASELPIISAVGHEVDFTIADMVADYRAPTPSAAAEHITPDQYEVMQQLDSQQRRLDFLMANRFKQLEQQIQTCKKRLKHPGEALEEKSVRLKELSQRTNRALRNTLAHKTQNLETLRHRIYRANPKISIEQAAHALNATHEKLLNTINAQLEQQQHKLALFAQTLNTASPLATLGRGYAILKSDKQKVKTQCSDFRAGEKISATLKDGVVHCTVDQSIPELDL
jgi:exodeoxyribonuclease VII large subunit